MVIYEIVQRKKFTESKIKDLDRYIERLNTDISIDNKTAIYNEALELKFKLLNKLGSYIAILREQNRINTVVIGSDELSIEEALYLKKTLCLKIGTLDTLISSGDIQVVNVFSLIQQRDSYIKDFILLDRTIKKSDMESTWEV